MSIGLRRRNRVARLGGAGGEEGISQIPVWFRVLWPVAASLPASAVFVSLLFYVPEQSPAWWFGSVAASFVFYLILSIKKPGIFFPTLATFTAGAPVAGAWMMTGHIWLWGIYLPCIFASGMFFSRMILVASVGTAGTYLAVSAYAYGRTPGSTETAFFVLTALSAAIVHFSKQVIGEREKKRHEEMNARPAPPALRGLEAEEDREIRDILKAAAVALRPDCVTLLLNEAGELTLTAATAADVEAARQGLAFDVLRYRHTLVSGNLEGVHYGPGYMRPGQVVSAMASPVLDGTYIAGVLVADSSREDAFSDDDKVVLEVFAEQVARVLSERRVRAETEQSVEWLRLLDAETSRLTSTLEPGAIVRMASETMQKIAMGDIYFFIRKAHGSAYRLLHHTGTSAPDSQRDLTMKDTLTGMALDDKAPKYFSDIRSMPYPVLPFDTPEVRSAMIVPFLYHGEPLGAAVLVAEDPGRFGPRESQYLGVLGNHLAVSLKNAMLHNEIKRRALTDGLTGLINHRHFMERLGTELKRFDRTGEPLTLLLFDADHFKRVNDTYGHPAGDQVLRDLAAIMRSTLRAQDVPARYGGEEFAAALSNTPPDSAMQLAERLRKAVMEFRFTHNDTHIPITVSIGLATCPFDDTTTHGLIQKADEALYRAKEGGRNRVVAWGKGSEPSSSKSGPAPLHSPQ